MPETNNLSTFERVAQWNTVCGKFPPEHDSPDRKEILLNQLKRVKEELDETIKAVEEGDELGMLDGGCDLDVVVSGYNFLLDRDYSGAIDAVLSNNDLKIYEYDQLAEASQRALELSEGGDLHTVHITMRDDVDLEEGTSLGDLTLEDLKDLGAKFSIHREHDDKVCKPANFPEVDLEPYL